MNGAQQGQAQGGHVQGQGNAQGYRPQNGGQNGAPNGSMSNGGGGRGPHGNGSAGGGGAHRYKPFNVTKYKPEAWQPSLRQPVPYTDEEYERILTLLDKVLGPEYVSFRPGGGGQSVSYIEGWRALNLANEIFGFNGWLLELISSQVDYFDTQHGTGRISMGLSVVVRITIRDGTYHEDFGYGYIENSKNKAMAFEKCKKEAFTDGLKRCLRCFGNVLGNCLYDRSLIPKLRKVKLPPAELEAENFHRDPLLRRKTAQQQQQAQQVQQAPQEAHTVGIPSVSMSASASSGSGSGSGLSLGSGSGSGSTNSSGTPLTSVLINPVPLAPSLGTSNSGGMKPPDKPVHQYRPTKGSQSKINDIVDDFDDSFVFSDDIQPMDDEKMSQNDGLDEYELEMLLLKNRENGGVEDPPLTERSNYESPSNDNSPPPPPAVDAPIPQVVSFVSAKAADLIRANPTIDDPSQIPQFDPKFVSTSIRRTVDPTKSAPIKRVTRSSAVVNTTPTTAGSVPIGTIAPAGTSTQNQTQTPTGTGNAPALGKRLLGLPPSQRQPYKRLHRDLSQPSQGDKENQPEVSQ